jgi:hypothetical protein
MENAAKGSAAGGTDEVREELEYWRLPRDTKAALEALQWDWGEAYEIGFDDGEWWYRRRDGFGGRESAFTPDALHKLIVEDYTFRPVRRDDVR